MKGTGGAGGVVAVSFKALDTEREGGEIAAGAFKAPDRRGA